MRKSSTFMISTLLFLGISSHAVSDTSISDEDRITELQWFKEKRINLALKLYEQMSISSGDKNIAMSPYSISKTLNMLLAGASSSTQSALFDVLDLGYSFNAAMVHDNASKIIMELENRSQRAYSLEAASAIWTEDDLQLNQDFQSILAQYYQTSAKTTDFEFAPEQARQQINLWALDNTAGHIEDLLPQGSIDQDTRMVVTDAIFYKGAWLVPFNPQKLTSDLFYKENGETKLADYMNTRLEYPYYENESIQAVGLPIIAIDGQSEYEQVMMVVLPKKDSISLSSFESNLSATLINSIWQQHTMAHVDLSLPKFSFSSETPLKQVLSSLGMEIAFDANRADFSGVFETPGDQIYLKDIYHKAYIDVNEKGIEAAAASAAVAGCTSAPISIVSMKVDHPFMFYVYDIPSNTIVFMGRVHDPL